MKMYFFQMPLHVTGVSEQESPFTFGTASPTLQFKWSVSNDKVAALQGLYNSVNVCFNLYFNRFISYKTLNARLLIV